MTSANGRRIPHRPGASGHELAQVRQWHWGILRVLNKIRPAVRRLVNDEHLVHGQRRCKSGTYSYGRGKYGKKRKRGKYVRETLKEKKGRKGGEGRGEGRTKPEENQAGKSKPTILGRLANVPMAVTITTANVRPIIAGEDRVVVEEPCRLAGDLCPTGQRDPARADARRPGL